MRRVVAVLLVSAMTLVGCGSDPEPSSTDSPTTQENTLTKPEVTVPDGPPPTSLVVNDLVEGDGEVLEPGGFATMHYVGVAYSTGEQFDASWDRGAPFETTIPGQLIQGWNEGIPGMKVGGRRELVIPSDMAYGDTSPGPGIGPGETLIFVVDLLAVQNP